ncbi:MAG TPA: HlyD family secretion protein [Rhizomicrobium sp.]|jgi:membrane fusion protein (multidrug efflux system)|nr:HlyD family secretion protein [Rhizomicrobium sp.]
MTAIYAEDTPRVSTLGQRLRALPKRTLIVGGAAVAAILIGAGWIAMPASSVSTDDAYVKADSTIVAPKVQGLISAILVRDNQRVVKGQPLLRIDDEDYAQAVQSAQAEVQSAQAALDQLPSQQALASANARVASVAIRSADAEKARALADNARFDRLATAGDISRSQADQARATAIRADAQAEQSRAALAASTSQAEFVARSRGQLLAALAKAKAALLLARQNLEHTVVRAPVDGVVGDRQAQIGEYVQPGTQLMTVVPLDTIYVVANFKETQTARMIAGQKARVEFDALPGKSFEGAVESFAPGSGSEFSLLPFEPATGNFTRIVQRMPVRIRIVAGQDGAARLRPGLSAEVRVDLR